MKEYRVSTDLSTSQALAAGITNESILATTTAVRYVQVTSAAVLTGPKGDPGADGADGYTPIKGVDYFDGNDAPTDHGLLTGLADDDHTQYHNDTRGDVRYYKKAEVDTALTGKVSKAGDTMTGALNISIPSLNTGDGQISLATGKGLQITNGATAGFRLVPNGSDLYLQNTASAGAMLFTGLNAADLTNAVIFKTTNAVRANATGVADLGSSSIYWKSLYATTHYFNSTAYISGATAGVAALTGSLTTTGEIKTEVTNGSVRVVNTGASLNNTASLRIYNNAASMGNQGGVRLVSYVSNADATQGYTQFDQINYQGNWVANLMRFDFALDRVSFYKNVVPVGSYSLGASNLYWSNLYATTQYFNSTAYISGATAGTAALTGNLTVSGSANVTGSLNFTPASGSQHTIRNTGGAIQFINATSGTYTGILNSTGLSLFSSGGGTNPTERLHVVGNGYFTGNVKADGEIESTDTTKGIILKSPNGTRYRVTVGDDGALTTTAV